VRKLIVAFVLLGSVACSKDEAADTAKRAGEDVKAVASAVADKAKDVAIAETVKIENLAYNPPRVEAKVGQQVKWTNKDSFDHTVTSDNDSFNSGDIGTNKSFDFRFTQAGTYKYYCQVHGKDRMSGTVVVE
jgi:plastocyanin